MTSPLDGDRKRALMLGAGSGLTAWLNLASVGNVPAKSSNILVVDRADLIHAEIADLAARIVAATAAAKPAPRPVGTAAATLIAAGAPRSLSSFLCQDISSVYI
jgi:hypothetical protein